MAHGCLYTFGYSGLRDGYAVRELLGGRVSVVVDVRLRPFSRNLAFSSATRRTVEDAGYHYIWERGLGNVDYKTGGIRLKDPSAIGTVTDALEAGENVAVMCVCSDPRTCHRRVVAELALAELGDLLIVDL